MYRYIYSNSTSKCYIVGVFLKLHLAPGHINNHHNIMFVSISLKIITNVYHLICAFHYVIGLSHSYAKYYIFVPNLFNNVSYLIFFMWNK